MKKKNTSWKIYKNYFHLEKAWKTELNILLNVFAFLYPNIDEFSEDFLSIELNKVTVYTD